MPAAPPESPPALGVAPPLRPAPRGSWTLRLPPGAGLSPRGLWLTWLTLSAAICTITFYATGGLNLETLTNVELAVTLACGLLVAGAVLFSRARRSRAGLWPLGLLLGLAALSAISVAWSVQPDASWRDADRLFAYAAVFAAAMVLVRIAPSRWPAVLGAVIAAAVIACGYALVTKIFPDHFLSANRYARLYEPFGYWNATGLTAAMGAIGCLWLGARRSGHALLNGLAYPAMGLLLTTLLLAYSRGSLVVVLLGAALWFLVVPLRLRGAAVLIVGAAGAGIVGGWDFATHALSAEGVELAERVGAGHELGALLAAVLVIQTIAGVGITFATARRSPTRVQRNRAGTALLAAMALGLVAVVAALAHSQRGFTGSISHAVSSLTNTHAKVPNTPGRLTAVASVRAQYWDEALKVFKAHTVLGAGAEGYETARLRYRTGVLTVKHAHGFVVQTMADLGLVGLVLIIALLLCWLGAAGRCTHVFNRCWTSWGELRERRRASWRRRPEPYGAERIGMLSMLCIVVVFGAHSFIDWTWYVPGDALVALLLAGWLAGRGALSEAAIPATAAAGTGAVSAGAPGGAPLRVPTLRGRLAEAGPMRWGLAFVAVAAALLLAWAQWQPQRSETTREQALQELESSPHLALASARSAVSQDPLSVAALQTLARVQSFMGRDASARTALTKSVRLQPSNPQSWLGLGRFDLERGAYMKAVQELQAAIYLDPLSVSAEALAQGTPEAIELHNEYIEALRGVEASRQRARAKKAAAALRNARASRSRAGRGGSKAARRRHAQQSG